MTMLFQLYHSIPSNPALGQLNICVSVTDSAFHMICLLWPQIVDEELRSLYFFTCFASCVATTLWRFWSRVFVFFFFFLWWDAYLAARLDECKEEQWDQACCCMRRDLPFLPILHCDDSIVTFNLVMTTFLQWSAFGVTSYIWAKLL